MKKKRKPARKQALPSLRQEFDDFRAEMTRRVFTLSDRIVNQAHSGNALRRDVEAFDAKMRAICPRVDENFQALRRDGGRLAAYAEQLETKLLMLAKALQIVVERLEKLESKPPPPPSVVVNALGSTQVAGALTSR